MSPRAIGRVKRVVAVLGVMACGGRAAPPSAPVASVPALVLRPATECAPATACERSARFTVVLHNDNGFSAAESLQVSLEPLPVQRRWPNATGRAGPRRVRRARFRGLGAAGRAGAAFDSVRAGAYDVRVEWLGLEAALWRVVLAQGCWSRLELVVAPGAQQDAVAPSSATLYSCAGATPVPRVPLGKDEQASPAIPDIGFLGFGPRPCKQR